MRQPSRVPRTVGVIALTAHEVFVLVGDVVHEQQFLRSKRGQTGARTGDVAGRQEFHFRACVDGKKCWRKLVMLLLQV